MARPGPDLEERLRRSRLHKYLLSDETLIIVQRQHWAALWKPIALALGAPVVILAFDFVRPASLGALANLLWWGWFGLLGWLFWKWLLWRLKWLVATDKRMLVNYGLVNQGVSMINLSRVSDLTYTRSTLGQLLHYGTLVRESSPRPGSLHEIEWVKDPHQTYLTICAAIFSLQDRMFGLDEDELDGQVEDGPPPPAPRVNPAYANADRPVRLARSPVEPEKEQVEDIPGIQIMYGGSQIRGPQRHQSPDLSQPALREPDTGPIPYRRSTTDAGGWSPTTDDPDA